LNAPIIAETAWPVRLLRRVRWGPAAVIVTRPDIATSLGKRELVGLQGAAGSDLRNGWEMHSSQWDGSYFHTTRIAAKARPTRRAGIRHPRAEVSMLEVHDCFSHHGNS